MNKRFRKEDTNLKKPEGYLKRLVSVKLTEKRLFGKNMKVPFNLTQNYVENEFEFWFKIKIMSLVLFQSF